MISDLISGINLKWSKGDLQEKERAQDLIPGCKVNKQYLKSRVRRGIIKKQKVLKF